MEDKKMRAEKNLKIVRNIFITLLIMFVVLLISIFTIDKCKGSYEMKLLEEKGYINNVSVGDYNLNAYTFGKDNGKHTIVGMAGMGSTDFIATITPVIEPLGEKNKVVIIDRAGYGLSDDTMEPQTVDRIIEDYRNALKSAGCKAPYVLMAHSLGGVYASYWQSLYPDEIEAVIYLDPTQIGDITFLEKEIESWDASFSDFVSAVGCKMGLYRVYDAFEPLKPWFSSPKETLEHSKALWYHTPYSFAMYSEADLCVENITKTYNSIKKNNVPKLYITANTNTKEDMLESFEYIKTIYDACGQEFVLDMSDEAEMNKLWEIRKTSAEEMMKTSIQPYVDMLGNCTLVNIPGDHHIYLHKPQEVLDACNEFLDNL